MIPRNLKTAPFGEIDIGHFDMEIWLPLAYLVAGSQNLPSTEGFKGGTGNVLPRLIKEGFINNRIMENILKSTQPYGLKWHDYP